MINMSPGLMLGPSPCTQVNIHQHSSREYLIFIAQVVRCRYEDHWVNSLAVPLEGPHTGSLLVALAQLGDVKEPGLCSLVKGGGEYEVAGEKDPEKECCKEKDLVYGTLDLLLDPGRVPFVDKQALAGGHIPPKTLHFSTSGQQECQFLTS